MRKCLGSFFSGMALIFDFSGYLTDCTQREILDRTDAEAIASDWAAARGDFARAWEQVRRDRPELPESPKVVDTRFYSGGSVKTGAK